MKILFDALGLPPYGGAKTSALGWIHAVAEQGDAHQFTVIINKYEPGLAQLENLDQIVVNPANRFGVRLWAQYYLPRIVRERNIDLVHFTKNLGSFFIPCHTVINVNDLTRLYYPTMFSQVDVLYWKFVQRVLLHRMDRIIAISESTKRDLIGFYHLPPEKIRVIFPAISTQFTGQAILEEAGQSVLGKYDIQAPYILSVGGMAVHKNVYTALRAFYTLLDKGLFSDYTFVIVGDQFHTHNDKRLFELANQRNYKQVRFTGSVDDKELPYIYRGASLLVYPSLYEGFGLVALEAMRCGVPVLAARLGSVPEVVGDAACFLDAPLDVTKFAETLAALLTDPRRLADMRTRGLKRSLAFTWEATAVQTLALYDEVCHA